MLRELDKKLRENTHSEDIACAVLLASVVSILVAVPMAILLWSWVWAIATASCGFAILSTLKFLKDSADSDDVQIEPTGRVSVDADYFMPYSVCPKCDDEALHWMREPDIAAATRTCQRFTDEVNRWKKRLDEYVGTGYHNFYLKRAPEETAAVTTALAILKGQVDVIRTCRARDCKHEWGQRIWSPHADAQ